MNLESQACFKFCMFSGSKAMVLDVYNRGKLSNLTHLVSKKYFSGHDWTIKAMRATTGFAITTNLMGATVWLDVVVGGEFDGLLTLVPANQYSGRVWQIKDHVLESTTYSIATLVDGVYKYIDIQQKGAFTNMAFLVNKNEMSGNYWKFLKVTHEDLASA
jgi:hypothetical protein